MGVIAREAVLRHRRGFAVAVLGALVLAVAAPSVAAADSSGGPTRAGRTTTTADASTTTTSDSTTTTDDGSTTTSTDDGSTTTTTDDGSTTTTTDGSTTTTAGVTPANTAPVAVDDSASVDVAVALDVLANDSDPDSDALTVTGTTAPSHGTASCGALGGCLYRADSGFSGTDSFTYTISDGNGGTATATVNLSVSQGGVNRPPVAVDDVLSTTGGSQSIDVLANDHDPDGDHLTVTASSDPLHGTASCTSGGTCTYTPDSGFSGFDSFTYTIDDGNGHTATASVQVRVAPAGAAFGVSVSGTAENPTGGDPSKVNQGDGAAWSVGVAPDPAGLTDELAKALPPPVIKATVTGDHTIDPASVTTAKGWTADASGATFTAGPDALLGDATTDVFPAPLPPISQGTGGDGHVPILVGSKVFGFFHHTYPTQVWCVDRATGTLCPGYPHQLNVGAGNIVGPGAVVGTQIWVHVFPSSFSYTQTAPIALYCWDAATDSTCGLVVVDRIEETSNPGASAPVLSNGKVYVAGDTGLLYCVDPSAHAPCADPSTPDGLGAVGFGEYDIVTHGGNVFVSRLADNLVDCVDPSADGNCSGWSAPVTFSGHNLINRHDASGATTGVCLVFESAGQLQCVSDSAPGSVTTYNGWPATFSANYYEITEEAETGTRTLFGLFSQSHGMGCWDWTTHAACTGGDYVNGIVNVDVNGAGLPWAYGAAWDGSCAVGVGDDGKVFTVDPAGVSPCTSLHSGTARVVDLRDQRCDGTAGAAAWKAVTISHTDLSNGGDFTSLIVTVRDATTGDELASQEMVGTNGVLDLSGIDTAQHPALSVDATANSSPGNPAWANGNAPEATLSWTPDTAQGCFHTTTAVNCSLGTSTIAVDATIPGDEANAALTLLPTTTCGTTTTTSSVSATTTTQSGPLPVTGSNTGPPVRGALLLVAVGMLFVLASRAMPSGRHSRTPRIAVARFVKPPARGRHARRWPNR